MNPALETEPAAESEPKRTEDLNNICLIGAEEEERVSYVARFIRVAEWGTRGKKDKE
jgi:hypothetical protein